MADRDGQAGGVCEFLEVGFPRPRAGTVAATAIGGNHQFLGLRVALLAQILPPTSDGCDGEPRRVVIGANAHPPLSGADVIDAVRHRLAELLVDKIVHAYLIGASLGTPLPPTIFEITHTLF